MKIIKLLLVLSLVLIFSACNSTRTREEKLSAIISKIDSPFLIASLSPQNIINKAGVNDGVLPYTQETLVNFFTNQKETGIDNAEKVQIIASKGKGAFPNMYMIFKVANSVKFEDVITKELNGEIIEKDGFKTVSKSSDGFVIVWNDEFGVVANVSFNLASLLGGGNGGSKTINRCITYIKYGNEGDIDDKYTNFLNKEADISSLFNSDYLVKYLGEMDILKKDDVKKLKEELKLNSVESYLSFNDGEIKWEHNMQLSDKLLEKINFIPKEGISDELFVYGKSAKPMFKYSFKMHPKPFVEYIESQANKNDMNLVTKELAKLGFTKNEIVQSFTGEVLFMIDDVVSKTKSIDYGFGSMFEEKVTEPVIGVVVGVSNKSTFEKVLEKTAEKTNNGVFNLEDDFFGYLTKDVFFVSNDSLWMDMVIKNKTVELKDEKGTLKEQPFGFYAGFDNIKSSEFYDTDFAVSEILENMSGFINLSEAELNIIFKDKTQNSLKVLIKFISDQMEEQKQKNKSTITDMLDEETMESMEEAFGQVEGVLEGVEEGMNVLEDELKKVDVNAVIDEIIKH